MRRTLSDSVVWLREPEERDLPRLERGLSDPDVVRWFGATSASVEAVLEQQRSWWRDLTGPTFAVCDAGDQFLGLVWVNRAATDERQGSVGYWLLPEARGRGIARRAVALLADWAFSDLGLDVLRVATEPGNAASRRVAEGTGFRFTGERTTGTLFDGRQVEYLVHEQRRVDSGPSRSSP